MKHYKKAISPVIATSLLLVIGVISVVGFQTWFNSYSSTLYSDINIGTSISGGIDTVIDSTLYFKNEYTNLSILDIKVDGKSCSFSGVNSSQSYLKINIGNCSNYAENSIYTLLVITKAQGVFSKNIYRNDFLTLDLDCSILNGGEWALVPGNSFLNTSDFCVMKYEAKPTNSSEVNLFDGVNMYCGDGSLGGGNNCLTNSTVNITSKAESYPLTQVYQTEARQLCKNLGNGYSLMTNYQWGTLMRDVEAISSNWANGVIGSTIASGGGLKRGNVGVDDSASYNAIIDPADRSIDTNSSAMYTLSTGDELWDIAGNVFEHTNDTFNSNAESSLGSVLNGSWVDWTLISGHNYLKSLNSSYGSTNHGIGGAYVDANDAAPSGTIHAIFRGGSWSDGTQAGGFAMAVDRSPQNSFSRVGFRCVYTQ